MASKIQKKMLLANNGRKFILGDQDMHTQYGFIKKEEFSKESGTVLRTNKDYPLFLLDASFIDLYWKMKRGPQIIPLKDVGFIIAETAVNKNSVVLDAGAGSGGLSLFLANMVKKVYTMDVRDDHLAIVKKNIEAFGLTNVKATLGSVYEDTLPKNIDLVTLDTPEPWLALANVNSVLKPGGFIVSYSPCTPQISDFVEAVEAMKDLVYLKTVELIEREWDFQGRKIRPKSQQRINHSGFLTFVRKVKK